MKKLLLIVTIIALFTACGTYNSVDSMSQLQSGMSKDEVAYYLGRPLDVLTVNYTQNGVQEVLAFRNNYDEVYAVEFWNNYLTGYEYMYDDRPYIAPAPPAMLPPAGRPIIVSPGRDRPSRPSRPSRPVRPSRPNNPDRPNYETRPDNNNNNNRPGNNNNSRPNNNNNSRPNNNNNNNNNNSGGRTSNGRYGNGSSNTSKDSGRNTTVSPGRNSSTSSSSSTPSNSSGRSSDTSKSTDNNKKSDNTTKTSERRSSR